MPSSLGRSQALYDSLTGAAYDYAVERPALARVAGRLLWSADIAVFYRPMDAIAEAPDGATILDVPCGGGVALRRLGRGQRLRYLAVDYSPGMLERTRRVASELGLTGVEYVQADVGALPFDDASVDLCVSSAGLHCFPDPARAVAEIARCLRPGGRLVGSMAVCGTSARHDAQMALFRRTGALGPGGTQSDLEAWVRDAGLSDLQTERSGALVRFEARK